MITLRKLKITGRLSALLMNLGLICSYAEASEPERGVAYAPVFEKLKKGANHDVSTPWYGPAIRGQYHAGHLRAIKEAGFESVRFFIPMGVDYTTVTSRVQEALEQDLAVVVCIWGSNSWSGDGNIESGINALSSRWRNIAQSWKDFPNDLVFEILNETAGLGFKNSSRYGDVMRLYNESVKAIREVDPDRPILIAPPGYNDSDKMDPWVSEEHLTYQLRDGSGFYEDPNIGVAIHFYRPNRPNRGGNWGMGTDTLKADWREYIDYEIDHAVAWRETYNANMPIVVTEWGCWIFEDRSKSDLTMWLKYHMDLYEKYNFGSMWYTAMYSNQYRFSIFNSELGWNQTVLDELTGVQPTYFPPTPQLLDAEFKSSTDVWKLTSPEVSAQVVNNANMSGTTALKVVVSDPVDCQLYQHTTIPNRGLAPGRTLIHLIEGQTYEISFMAKTESGTGQLKVNLRSASDKSLYYDSYETEGNWVQISKQAKLYTLYYTHTAPTELDARFEFDVGSMKQTLYLDKANIIRVFE